MAKMAKKLLSLCLTCFLMLSCLLLQAVSVGATNAVDYLNAPYAGVYEVTSSVATTVTTEIGSVTNLAAGETGYIYLIKGMNNVTVTNSANITITELENNGLDYLNQVNVPTQPVISGQEDAVATGLYHTLAPGASYTFTYTPSKGLNGIVYAYFWFSDKNESTYEITTNTGFKTTIYKPSGDQNTLAWSDAERTQVAFLYVRNGAQDITITNIGENTGTIGNLNIHSVGEYRTDVTVNELTPIPYIKQDVASGAERVDPATLPGANKMQAEAVASGISDGDRTVVSVGSGGNMSFNFTALENTTMDLYLCGSAWKDVSFDVYVDGTLLSYETMHFNTPWQGTAVYSQEKVYSFPVTKGNHSIRLYFYTDSFRFDYMALMPHYSDVMMLLNGIPNATTANEVYDLLMNHGASLGITVEEDTANLHAPATAFWSMVGKNYETLENLYDAYDAVLAREASTPSVTVSGNTATILGTYLPADATVVVGVYNGNKLLKADTAVKSGTSYTADVTGYGTGKTLKVMAMVDMDSLTPDTTDGVYAHY